MRPPMAFTLPDFVDQPFAFGCLYISTNLAANPNVVPITPPVGLNVFIINKLAGDVSISETFKGVLPFLISDIFRVILLFSFPGITLFLLRIF